MEPSRGMRFTHARQVDRDRRPVRMIVTAVRDGEVFYCPDDGESKGLYRISVDRFPEIVRDDGLPDRPH